MRKILVNLVIIISWSAVLITATMLLAWYIVQRIEGTVETFAIVIFFSSFIYILIGTINAIGNHKRIDRSIGDYSYHQAKTITLKSDSESDLNEGFIKNKFYRLSFTMFLVGVILIFTGLAINSSYEPDLAAYEPEIPLVTVGEQKIPVTMKSYVYSRLGSTYSYGDYSISTIELAKGIEPTIVAPESKLYIEFFEEYPDTVYVEHNKQRFGSDRLTDEAIIVPKEEGRYIYTIHAHWEYTDADYLFVIQVEK